ncbi:MAG: YncE family protein [Bacteroidetes bacterium]|nr:YncE family protein [Bacteroidota bacterium]
MKTLKIMLRVVSLILLPALAIAQNQSYVLDKTIPLTGDNGYDYAFIDQPNHVLYASHGNSVNVVDLRTEKQVSVIGDMKGVHGIAVVHDLNRGFISDGKGSAVIVFDTKTYKTIKVIPITGKDADCIIYDPYSKKIFVFEGDDNAAVVVDPKELKQTATIPLGGAPEFAVSDGSGLIYNNLEDKNSLNVIDTKTLKVLKNYSLSPCGGPTGLAIDKEHKRLFTVCRENKGLSVVDIPTSKVIQTVPIGAGVDAVIYDQVNKLVVASNADGTATVIKQNTPDSYAVVQTLKTQYRAKTMALDLSTHKLYFPVADFQQGSRAPLPGTFKLLVYKLN